MCLVSLQHLDMAAAKNIIVFFAALILAPIGFALMMLFMGVWLALTISCIGPVAAWLATRSDTALLDSFVGPNKPVHRVNVGGCNIAMRWSPARDDSAFANFPVVIPNGLGATLITISRLHERLSELGFPVLSYDRAGVGLSGPRLPAAKGSKDFASTDEVVADMAAVLASTGLPPGTKWIIVGPSMGSIVAQAFIAKHADSVCGFLNMDGFPFPFAAKRARFEWAAVVYRVYASIVWTGALRPFLFAASGNFAPLASRAFPVAAVRAQMNQRNFFASLASEMLTMMDLSDAVRAAWGNRFDLQSVAPADLEPLVNAQPSACGDFKMSGPGDAAAWSWQELPRSAAEHGAKWTSLEDARAALKHLADGRGDASEDATRLPAVFATLPVRVMSARSYDFGWPISAFYDREMQDFAASEHNLHVLSGAAGSHRVVFPSKTHMGMFFGAEAFIADMVVEIAEQGKTHQPVQV